MHGLVPERLETIESKVYPEKVGSGSEDVVAVLLEHLLDHLELGIHFKQVVDHLLRLLEISVDHGDLGVAQELSVSFRDIHA